MSNEAEAPQSALRIIMPSPAHVNWPLSAPPRLSDTMPAMPTAQPTILRMVILSLLKNKQAMTTTAKTLSELRMAAREPSLCDNPK